MAANHQLMAALVNLAAVLVVANVSNSATSVDSALKALNVVRPLGQELEVR